MKFWILLLVCAAFVAGFFCGRMDERENTRRQQVSHSYMDPMTDKAWEIFRKEASKHELLRHNR